MRRIVAAMILAPAIVGAQNLVTNPTMEKTGIAAFRKKSIRRKESPATTRHCCIANQNIWLPGAVPERAYRLRAPEKQED